MSKSLAISKGVALASLCFYALAGAGRAHANVLVNGWFTEPGINGPQYCGSGWSSAAGWSQFAVVTNSYICTTLETNFLPRVRVETDGGDS